MVGEYASVAKITRPSVTGVFQRKRLFRLLDTFRKHPVIWISAPAGSGKTTLISSYLVVNKLPCLWYQVDEGDSDIATFFSYMGVAAKKASPRRRTSLPLLTPEYSQNISTFTLRYFEKFFSWFKAPYVLVLDNYQSVPADSNFHSMISDGLSSIPDGMNVIILSRHDIPPALSRLRANSLIGMLGWDELRLRLEESGGIVRLRTKGKTPKQMIQHLHDATGGWAAGLVLMLESLKRGIEPHLLGKLTPKEIIDYFGNEFFNKIEKKVQEFLLKTAFLPRMTAKMAERLTGLSNAGSILSTLSRSHNFTEEHNSSEPMYQYHPLLTDFLTIRAKAMFSQDDLSILLHKAAALLEETGQIEAAISLFCDLGDWNRMSQLIIKQAPSMLEQGRYRPLEEWLDRLPKEMLENDPWLLYDKGAVRFPFNPSHAHSYFEGAFEQFKIQNDLIGTLLAWSGAVDSIFYRFENYSALDQWIELFPELPENPEKIIPSEVWIHVVSSMSIALTYRRLGHSETEIWIRRAESIVQWPVVPVAKAQLLFQMVHYYLATGDYEQSLLNVQLLQHLSQSEKALPLVIVMTRFAEAMYYNLTGDDEKCLKVISEGLMASERTGIYLFYYFTLAVGILSYQNIGDIKLPLGMLEKLASAWDHLKPYAKILYHFVQARQFLLRSELDLASTQIELSLKAAMDLGTYKFFYTGHMLAAQIMHGIGRYREAWTHLHEAFHLAEWFKSAIWDYSCLMIEAHFHFEQGEEASGLASLRKALAIGKENEFLKIYVGKPAVATKLCIKALEEEIEVPYVQRIIRKWRLIPEKPPFHLENWPWPFKVYALGKFELLRDDKPLHFSGKLQQKPLLLLKALIAQGGKEVKERHLSDMLWPEADGDKAYSAFRTTLSRLRQLIGDEKAIEYHKGKATIDPRYCWVDAWAFERIFEQIEAESKRTLEDEKVLHLIEKAIDLYQGHFLEDEAEAFWIISYRERLRKKYLLLITKLGHFLQKKEEWENAVGNYERGIEVDHLAEEFYQRLMICHKHLGCHARAIEVYKRCKKTLNSILGVEPSPMTEAIYKTLAENTNKILKPLKSREFSHPSLLKSPQSLDKNLSSI